MATYISASQKKGRGVFVQDQQCRGKGEKGKGKENSDIVS